MLIFESQPIEITDSYTQSKLAIVTRLLDYWITSAYESFVSYEIWDNDCLPGPDFNVHNRLAGCLCNYKQYEQSLLQHIIALTGNVVLVWSVWLWRAMICSRRVYMLALVANRSGKNTHISMISNSVTHLQSYTNTAIANITRNSTRAPISSHQWQVFHDVSQCFKCFMMFY